MAMRSALHKVNLACSTCFRRYFLRLNQNIAGIVSYHAVMMADFDAVILHYHFLRLKDFRDAL